MKRGIIASLITTQHFATQRRVNKAAVSPWRAPLGRNTPATRAERPLACLHSPSITAAPNHLQYRLYWSGRGKVHYFLNHCFTVAILHFTAVCTPDSRPLLFHILLYSGQEEKVSTSRLKEKGFTNKQANV